MDEIGDLIGKPIRLDSRTAASPLRLAAST